ncbi:hypothetical protein ABH940_005547 [Streptacidiphilus sp. BW17]|uniref:hypothetical protein n=1 Tax=Streptacidiphilus sp. BW17 TaxID=3156274 RepID=UPI003518C4B6
MAAITSWHSDPPLALSLAALALVLVVAYALLLRMPLRAARSSATPDRAAAERQ